MSTDSRKANRLVIRRTIAAPPEAIFAAWTDARGMQEWMRPGDMLRAEVALDVHVGGKFRIVMHGREGRYEHTGEYRVVDPPKRLAFTWVSANTQGRVTLVTIDLRPAGPGTELVLTHEDLPDQVAVERHSGGWGRILELLGERLAG